MSDASDMEDARSVSGFYGHDHDRLDESFARYRQLKHSDFPQARESFMTFYEGLMAHIEWEEEVLFPVFEDKIGDGLTGTMRREHEQIREVLESLRETIKEGTVPEDKRDEQLLKFLNPHNEAEESVVYPEIDRQLSDDELEDVFDSMEPYNE